MWAISAAREHIRYEREDSEDQSLAQPFEAMICNIFTHFHKVEVLKFAMAVEVSHMFFLVFKQAQLVFLGVKVDAPEL